MLSSVYIITRLQAGNFAEPFARQAEGLCSFWLEEDRLVEIHREETNDSLLGNIYVGKVRNVLKNIEAAFVEIADGRICFLPFSEAQTPILTNRVYDNRLLAGDEILVQVKKDAVKTKDPVLTAKLSVTGQYAAVSIDAGKGIRYSQKLSEESRRAVKEALLALTVPLQMTLIVRTQAGELTDFGLLVTEAEELIQKAKKLLQMGRTRTVFSLLSEDCPGYLKRLQNSRELPDKILTDDLTVYQVLREGLGDAAEHRLSFCDRDRTNLSLLYKLGAGTQEALSKKVWLKSGGYLVIEPTEALTVIDVNSGKYTGKKSTTETFALINEEAAAEVARQLRLRNLSGIILVDFINEEGREAGKRLLASLRSACKSDPVPVQVVDMTALGLVEITRKKVERPLAEQFAYQRRE